MILEVIDQGRLERLALVNGSAGKDIDGRAYIGGYHLNSGGYGSVWNVETLPKQDGIIAYRLTRKAD